jgi:SAM-dependent methyltransferase
VRSKLGSSTLTSYFLLSTFLLATAVSPLAQSARRDIPYNDVQPIFDALRANLLPSELRDLDSRAREAAWPGWVRRRDAAVRSRVESGDEDSIVYFLLFGTAFTRAPRASERDLAALVSRPAEALAALKPRIDDFAAAVASPSQDERLQFARGVVERRGIDPATAAGRVQLHRYLEERATSVGGSVEYSRLLNPSAALADKLTVFRDRGLSTDTAVFVNFGIDQALREMKQAGAAPKIQRVAIVGPGLDFTDKLEGYDFYPVQTIQPFALIDSLLTLDLADEKTLQLTAFDISPRVLQHLESARSRARAGTPYSIVLPRNPDRPWAPGLVEYWMRAGTRIGTAMKAPPAPAAAGRVDARAIAIRPSIVSAITPVDLDIVAGRLDLPVGDMFDLVVVTNLFLYYDVFEQSLAAANIARMLRPGGFLLTNNRIFEVPSVPLTGVGYTDVVYMSLAGVGDTGDRVIWYERR